MPIITVHPHQAADGSIAWELCTGGTCGGPGHAPPSAYPTVTIPAYDHNPLFVVNIDDPSHTITFADDPTNPYNGSNAAWFEVGQGKHPGPGNHSDGQISNVTLANGTTLVFNNANANKGWLSYALNFEQGGHKVNSIDPDIKNGGGGNSLSFLNVFSTPQSAAITIAAAVILVILGVWIGRVWKKA